jgi:hypothetical protein
MMDVGLHHRGVDPQLRTILQSELDRRPNHQVVDGFERLRCQSDEAALKRVVLGHRRAVEVGELTQRQSVGDPLAQLAIVPVLEPHQNQRAQDLSRRQSAATTSGLLQPARQIAPDPLDHVSLVVEKVGYRPQQWFQAHALSPLPHQFPIGKTDLSRRRSRHRSALPALRRFRPLSLQRLDVARRSLLQQFLQGAPIVQTATHFGHQLFRNVDRNSPSLHSAVQNVGRMLLAGPAGRAVLANTRAATKAQ